MLCKRFHITSDMIAGSIKQNQKARQHFGQINNSIYSAVLTVDTCPRDKQHAVDSIHFGRHNRKFVPRVHPVVPTGTYRCDRWDAPNPVG